MTWRKKTEEVSPIANRISPKWAKMEPHRGRRNFFGTLAHEQTIALTRSRKKIPQKKGERARENNPVTLRRGKNGPYRSLRAFHNCRASSGLLISVGNWGKKPASKDKKARKIRRNEAVFRETKNRRTLFHTRHLRRAYIKPAHAGGQQTKKPSSG